MRGFSRPACIAGRPSPAAQALPGLHARAQCIIFTWGAARAPGGHELSRLCTRATAVALTIFTLLLAGCGGGAHSNDAHLRLVNASTGFDSLDLYVDDSLKAAAVLRGAGSGYVEAGYGDITAALTRTGASTVLTSSTPNLGKNKHYTLLAYGASGAIKTLQIGEERDSPASGKALLQVINVAPDAGNLDLYLTGSDESLVDAVPVASSLVSGVASGDVTPASGTRRLRVTAAGSKTDLRLDIPSFTLGNQQVGTLVLSAGSGGLLVDALLIVQQGAVTLSAGTQARVRALSAVSGTGSVTASVGGTSLLGAAVAPTIGSYVLVDAGSPAIVASVAGPTGSVAVPQPTPAPVFTAGVEYTLLVWGDAASPQMAVLTDDNRLPTDSTTARLRLIHAVTGLADTLSLTYGLSPVGSPVSPGAASGTTAALVSASSRIEVRTPANPLALYAPSATDANLAAGGVYTVLMHGTLASPQGQIKKER